MKNSTDPTSSVSEEDENMKSKRSSIDNAIVEMMAVDSLQLSFLQGLGFNRLIKQLEPGYERPDIKYFSLITIPSIHEKVKNKVSKIILDSDVICFSYKIYTTGRHQTQNYVEIIAHCCNRFERKSAVVKVVNIPAGPTSISGNNINSIINQSAKDLQIPLEKILTNIWDNENRFNLNSQKSSASGLLCFPRTLETIMKFAIHNVRRGDSGNPENMVIQNCRQIIRQMNHSTSSLEKIKELQELHSLPQNKITRIDFKQSVGDIFDMVKYFCEQKKAISDYCKLFTGNVELDCAQWEVLQQLSVLLLVYHQIISRMVKPNATISEIIPQIKYLYQFLVSSGVKLTRLTSILKTLKEKMDHSLISYLDDNDLILSTFLDPRYKGSLFQDYPEFDTFIDELITSKFKDEKKSCPLETKEVNENSQDEDFENLEFLDFTKYLNQVKNKISCETEKIDTDSSTSSSKQTITHPSDRLIKEELKKYRQMEPISCEEDPFQWWKKHSAENFPILGSLAERCLSCPPSSVSADEPICSDYGTSILLPNRNDDDVEVTKQLLYLRHNFKLFNFSY